MCRPVHQIQEEGIVVPDGVPCSLSTSRIGAKAVILFSLLKGNFVRKADIWAECSEGLLPAIFTSGGVAASSDSGYALEVMREHMERVW
jgi:hypothetical protein